MKLKTLFYFFVSLLLVTAVYAGTVMIKGTNIYYEVTQEIEIGAARFAIPASDFPAQAIIGDTYVLQFDKNSNESIYVVRHVVPDYATGSNWSVAFYWAPTTTGTNNVTWCVSASPITSENNEIIAAGTVQCVNDAGQGTTNEVLKTPLIVIDGSSFIEDDVVPIRVHRGATLASDNYAADASLFMATIYYTANKLGE